MKKENEAIVSKQPTTTIYFSLPEDGDIRIVNAENDHEC
jgi:hypothetical protein